MYVCVCACLNVSCCLFPFQPGLCIHAVNGVSIEHVHAQEAAQVCVLCVRAREWERMYVFGCLGLAAGVCLCMCVCVRARERE